MKFYQDGHKLLKTQKMYEFLPFLCWGGGGREVGWVRNEGGTEKGNEGLGEEKGKGERGNEVKAWVRMRGRGEGRNKAELWEWNKEKGKWRNMEEGRIREYGEIMDT